MEKPEKLPAAYEPSREMGPSHRSLWHRDFILLASKHIQQVLVHPWPTSVSVPRYPRALPPRLTIPRTGIEPLGSPWQCRLSPCPSRPY